MRPFERAIWGHIWKRTAKKNQTNATCVIMHPLGQTNWGHIWKFTVEKSQTNATIMWFREKEGRPNFSGKTLSYSMLEVEGTPRPSWLLSNTCFIWSYHLDLRLFGWTLKRAKNAWHLCSTKLKGVDFYIELFDNKKFGKVFILPGHFFPLIWYDFNLRFIPHIFDWSISFFFTKF